MYHLATSHRFRLCAALLAASVALPPAASTAFAQDGAQPREIPEGFVLPGPAPTGSTAPTARTDDAGTDASTGAASAGTQNPMAFARAPEEGATNWPCVQRKVEGISAAQVWAGPPLPSSSEVSLSDEERQLIDQLVGRRLPLNEAEKMAVDYLEALPQEQRATEATRLVSALLDRFNGERTEVMAGIERYGAKQKALAEHLRERSTAFSTMQRDSEASNNDIENARQALLWDTRVFDERRRSLTYVCEVPVLIEQRAFGLGRAMASAL